MTPKYIIESGLDDMDNDSTVVIDNDFAGLSITPVVISCLVYNIMAYSNIYKTCSENNLETPEDCLKYVYYSDLVKSLSILKGILDASSIVSNIVSIKLKTEMGIVDYVDADSVKLATAQNYIATYKHIKDLPEKDRKSGFMKSPEFVLTCNFTYEHVNERHYKSFVKLMKDLLIKLRHCTLSINNEDVYAYFSSLGFIKKVNAFYKKIFGNYIEKEYEAKDGVKPVLKYNGPKKLSTKSTKKLSDFMFGDILYATMDGEYMSQNRYDGKRNFPIAFYIGDGVFMSFIFASCFNPDKGNSNADDIMFSGSRYNEHLLPDTKSSAGVVNTKVLYKFINKEIEEVGFTIDGWPINKVIDNSVKIDENSSEIILGAFPVMFALYRFHTIGTKSGDWFLPSIEELSKTFTKENMAKLTDVYDEYDMSLYKYKFDRYIYQDTSSQLWSSSVQTDEFWKSSYISCFSVGLKNISKVATNYTGASVRPCIKFINK